MKFLLFNGAILCALYYLFTGTEGQGTDDLRAKAESMAKTVRAEIATTIATTIDGGAEARPLDGGAEARAIDGGAEVLPPQQPRPQPEIQQPVPVAEYRAAPPPEAPASEPAHQSAAPVQLMSPRERRRELARLAHDMELLFVDRLER